jgi:hypothetical protein
VRGTRPIELLGFDGITGTTVLGMFGLANLGR